MYQIEDPALLFRKRTPRRAFLIGPGKIVCKQGSELLAHSDKTNRYTVRYNRYHEIDIDRRSIEPI